MPGSLDNSEFRTHAARMKNAHGQVGAKGARLVKTSTLRMESLGKANAPVDTGELQASIFSAFSGDGRFGEMEGTVDATAGHRDYVEYGTSRMPPQAYLGPALNTVGPAFEISCEALGIEQAIG